MPKAFYLSIFIVAALFTFCSKDNNEKTVKILSFSIAEKLPVPEPSGLDLTFDETGFWIVSDENSKVYLIDSWGRIVKSLNVNGQDLEGITVVDDSTLAHTERGMTNTLQLANRQKLQSTMRRISN